MTRSRRRQLTAVGAVTALITTCERPRAGDILLESVRVFDPVSGRFSGPTDVLIRGDQIVMTGSLRAPGTGVTSHDLAGKYALPGLWDSHVHFSFLRLVAGSDSAVADTLEAFVRNGVTSVRDVGGPLETIAALSRRIELDSIQGPRIYFAGPLLSRTPFLRHVEELNKELPGIAAAVESPADVDSMLDRLVAHGARVTKAIGRWGPALFRHYMEAAKARTLRVVLDPGAPLLTFIPLDTALALGVGSIEHGQAVWREALQDGFKRDVDTFMASGRPLVEGDSLLRHIMALGEQSLSKDRLQALVDRWARSETFFTPTLIQSKASLARGPPQMYRRPLEGRLAVEEVFVRELSAGGVKLLVGQDFIEPDGTLKEMEALAEAGVSPIEILRGSTIYPAGFMGVEDSVGTIARGKRADVVILDSNPLERIENIRSVRLVVHAGKVFQGKSPSTSREGAGRRP